MARQWIALLVVWVLVWLAVVAIVVPLTALARPGDRRGLAGDWAAALVWTWLTVSIAVPLAAAVGAFNWATALLISVAWPLALWYVRHHHDLRAALVALVRRLVLRGMSVDVDAWRHQWVAPQRALLSGALPLLAAPLVSTGADLRLPAPPDFDTLRNVQLLLGNTATWDPLASLGALLMRTSTASPLIVVDALRLALAALASVAVAAIAADLGASRGKAIMAGVVLMLAAPTLPVSIWAALLVALLGTVTLLRWMRASRASDGWHTVAAAALLVGQLFPLASSPAPIVTRQPRFVEPPAAPLQALAITRANRGDDWMIVAPPQQRLASSRPDRHYDLATFVDRFSARAGDRQFRFAVPAQRVYLFIELAPDDLDAPVRDSRVITGEAAVYRVPRERRRLQARARQLCDDYRRTHAGARITYDDGALRVCEITV